MNKSLFSLTALAAALVLFFAVNILGGTTLRGARVDLTEGKLYTLSEGSRNVARKLQEPIKLTLYYSEKATNDAPSIKSYATRVKEILREYEQVSGGKIKLQIVNPEPFSEDQDKADQAGVAGLAIRPGGEPLYFGLLGVNSTDKQQVIPFFDPSKEGFLEYDLTRMIYLLSDPPKKTIGLMSWLPMEGAQFNPMQRTPSQPWQIVTQMKELFDVKTVETTAKEIPGDVNVLMVVHPKGMSPETQYAVDQFVLRGGRLLLFVDPLCESDVPPGVDRFQAMQMPKNSELATLMAAWGVEMDGTKVAGDRKRGFVVGVGRSSQEGVPFLPYLNLQKTELNQKDPITGGLNTLLLVSAGILKPKDGATTTFSPLVHTTTDSMEVTTSEISMIPDPKALLAKFSPSNKEFVVAARVEGKVKSAFPNGAPAPKPAAEGQPPAEAPKGPHLAESTGPINVVIVADADMLQDRFWIQQQRLGPIDLGFRKITDNGELVTGVLDNLSGSSDLINLRARGTFARPFDTVEEIERKAQQQYAAKQAELDKKLQETEAEINKLQQQRPDGQSTMFLTPEQQKKLEEFQKQRGETRKEKRAVQHELRKDIERLGTAAKVANMAIMPGIVALLAVGLGAYRANRRKADRARPTTRS